MSGLPYEGAGDGQTLFLTAGEVASPCSTGSSRLRLGFHELRSLCRFQRSPEVGVGGILAAQSRLERIVPPKSWAFCMTTATLPRRSARGHCGPVGRSHCPQWRRREAGG